MDSSPSTTPLSAAELKRLSRQNRDLNETPEDRKVRLGKEAEQKSLRRKNQHPEHGKLILKKDSQQHQLQRQGETPELRIVRLSNVSPCLCN
jgi:hypothetical protein